MSLLQCNPLFSIIFLNIIIALRGVHVNNSSKRPTRIGTKLYGYYDAAQFIYASFNGGLSIIFHDFDWFWIQRMVFPPGVVTFLYVLAASLFVLLVHFLNYISRPRKIPTLHHKVTREGRDRAESLCEWHLIWDTIWNMKKPCPLLAENALFSAYM